jgi:hypothetical protein
VTVAAVLAGALPLAGCSMQKTVSGWFGGRERARSSSEAAAGRAYYAAAAGLKVYSEPTTSAKVVGKLALHEKVTRYKVKRGYAYVKADASDLEGWVNNSMLLWRLPATAPGRAEPPTAAPAEAATEEPPAPDVPSAAEPPEPAPPPPDTPPTRETPRPSPTGPAVFDPY